MLEWDRIRRSAPLATLEYQPQMASTNDRARQLLAEGQLACPALIITRQQTAGRGQPGRTWWSSTDSLTFSWCLEVPADAPPAQLAPGLFPLAAADALCASLQHLDSRLRPQIKWPNDVLLGGGKVAGILVESLPTATGRGVIVGIGINVNQDQPPRLDAGAAGKGEIWPAPTSLRLESGRSWELTELLSRLLAELHHRLASPGIGPAELCRRCEEKLFLKGVKIAIAEPNSSVTRGVLAGLAPDGGLRIKTDQRVQTLYSGSLVPPGPPSDAGR